MDSYGEEFARIYNRKWDLWGRMLWPFITRTLAERDIDGGRWLDLCCGTGLLLKLAAEKGFETTGVDFSPHQLKHARKKAPAATLIEADVRKYVAKGKFNVVTCLFDSVNYIVNPGELGRLFARVARHLTPQGVFIFDLKTPALFLNEETRIFDDNQSTTVFRPEYDERTAIYRLNVTGFLKVRKLYRRFDETHVQRGYTIDETNTLLGQAGLRSQVCGATNFSSDPPDEERPLYVCHL